jgi:hypothetical protein
MRAARVRKERGEREREREREGSPFTCSPAAEKPIVRFATSL